MEIVFIAEGIVVLIVASYASSTLGKKLLKIDVIRFKHTLLSCLGAVIVAIAVFTIMNSSGLMTELLWNNIYVLLILFALLPFVGFHSILKQQTKVIKLGQSFQLFFASLLVVGVSIMLILPFSNLSAY